MHIILLLAVLGGLAYRMASPEDRARYLRLAMRHVRRLRVAAAEPGPEYESFREALRARTPHALVTPAFVAINVMVVAGMLFGAGAISDPDTLVAWGASIGTRTTNGEWWRLVTSSFLHTGTLHLLVDVAVLIQLGAVIERLAGRLVFAGVYLSAGAFAGLVSISSHPTAVTTGASGAIAGLYGLLLALLTWQLMDELIWQRSQRRREDRDAEDGADADERVESGVTIPLIAMKRLGLGAARFLVSCALNGPPPTAAFTGPIRENTCACAARAGGLAPPRFGGWTWIRAARLGNGRRSLASSDGGESPIEHDRGWKSRKRGASVSRSIFANHERCAPSPHVLIDSPYARRALNRL